GDRFRDMVCSKEPISPGGSALPTLIKPVSPPLRRGLDLYRISDRCTASVSAASSGNAEISSKTANLRQQTPNQTEAAKPRSRSSSRSSSSSSPGSGASQPYESSVEGATCPTPIAFRRSWAEKVTGEVRGEKIELVDCKKELCPVCGPRL